MKTRVELGCPNQSHVVRGPVSSMTWVTTRKDSCETLCYGTGLGYLVFWRQNSQDVSGGLIIHTILAPDIQPQGYFEELRAKRLGTGCEITCIDCDFSVEDTVRLVIGTRDRLVQVWELDPEEKMKSIFSVQLNVTVPKAVAFADNRAKDVYVFGLYDGNMYVCSGFNRLSKADGRHCRHVLKGGDGKVMSSRDVGTIM